MSRGKESSHEIALHRITPSVDAGLCEGPHRARRPRLDRGRARARPPARPRRVRRRERAARSSAARSSPSAPASSLLALASTPLHGPAPAVGARPGRRDERSSDSPSRSRARRTAPRPRGLGLASAPRDPGRLVVPRRAPLARQLVAARAALSGARRALAASPSAAPSGPSWPRPRRTRPRRAAAPISRTATGSTSTASALARRRSFSSTASANGRRTGPGCRRTCRQRRASARSTAPEKAGAAATPFVRTGTSWPPTCTRSFALRTFPGRTSLPGTRSAAPTRSSTRRSIRGRSPGSR